MWPGSATTFWIESNSRASTFLHQVLVLNTTTCSYHGGRLYRCFVSWLPTLGTVTEFRASSSSLTSGSSVEEANFLDLPLRTCRLRELELPRGLHSPLVSTQFTLKLKAACWNGLQVLFASWKRFYSDVQKQIYSLFFLCRQPFKSNRSCISSFIYFYFLQNRIIF